MQLRATARVHSRQGKQGSTPHETHSKHRRIHSWSNHHDTRSYRRGPDAATDPRIDPQVRSFLTKLNKDRSPFWELPQPKPQEILSGLQSQTAVDMSGVTTTERTISQDGRSVKLYVMKPA